MDAKQYEALVADAEMRLKRLRALYDQWFAGIERIEPNQQRKELDTVLNTLKREQVRNTALRFRMQQIVQRYTTYNTYWRRISRQIEEGTYKRDVIRARRLVDVMPSSVPPPPRTDARDEAKESASANGKDSAPAADAVDVEIDHAVDSVLGAFGPGTARLSPRPPPLVSPMALPNPPNKLEPARSFPAPAPGAVRPPPPPAAAIKRPPPPPPAAAMRPPAVASKSADGIGEDQMQRIYQKYVEARRANQERTDVKFESVASSVRGMMPKLLQKHAGKSIDFEVIVRDGKVALKPVAK
jgi:hypothetical protein